MRNTTTVKEKVTKWRMGKNIKKKGKRCTRRKSNNTKMMRVFLRVLEGQTQRRSNIRRKRMF
jgi:hypothetical protein